MPVTSVSSRISRTEFSQNEASASSRSRSGRARHCLKYHASHDSALSLVSRTHALGMTSPMLPRERCDYSAIVDRPPLRLPGNARLAFWTIALNYNLTEAAFKAMHPTWLLFLIAVSALPLKEESAVGATQAFVSNRLDAPVVSPRQWRPLHDRRARLHSRSQSPTDSPHNFRKA